MNPKTSQKLEFLINLAYIASIIFLCYIGINYVFSWVLPFILAFIIVLIINPVIKFVTKRLNIKHEIISIIIMFLLYAIVGILIFEFFMMSIVGLRNVLSYVQPYTEENLLPALANVQNTINSFISQFRVFDSPDSLIETFDLGSTVAAFINKITSMGLSFLSNISSKVPSFLIGFIFTIMLSFFISMQYDNVLDFLFSLLPKKARDIAFDLKNIGIELIGKYFVATLKIMVITFVLLIIGFLIIKIPYAVVFALGIAVFDALPVLGTGTILIPWGIIELIQGNITQGAGLLIIYVVILVMRNIIEPQIIGQKLGLNPIVSIVSIYVGFKLFGFVGMIAMPIITQIVLELNNRGIIKLFKKSESDKA